MRDNLPGEAFFKPPSYKAWIKIILFALIFHGLLFLGIFLFNQIRKPREVELIPIFELVQVAPLEAPSAPVQKNEPVQEPSPPKKEIETPPKPPLHEPKPKVKQDPPEPKPEPPKEIQEETPEAPEISESEEVKEVQEVEPVPSNDFDIDDMELPEHFEKSSLSTVGSVTADPLLQAFLERLKQLVMQNFNPPNGLQIPRNAKTTVQFTVSTSGSIANVTLKHSSGNKTWDALSVRAVQITQGPMLPKTYRGELLSLQFNFTPN